MSEAEAFVEQWSRIWREHDGVAWQDLLHPECVLRNPLGQVTRADLPGYMANLVRGVPGHGLAATRWGETADGVLIEWSMTGTFAGRAVEIRGADRFTLRDGRATEGFAYFDPAPMGGISPAEVDRLAREYDAAWNSGDVDAIVARHAAAGSYHLHVADAPVVTGREAMRRAFATALENWRELAFELDHVQCGPGFYVWRSTVRGTLEQPLRLGAVTIEPTGEPLAFTGIDVVILDGHGLIERKDTSFDILAAANQAAQNSSVAAGRR